MFIFNRSALAVLAPLALLLCVVLLANRPVTPSTASRTQPVAANLPSR